MTQNNSKLLLVFSCVFVTKSCSNLGKKQSGVMNDSYPTLESLKDGITWVTKWWDFDFNDSSFSVCLQEFPSFGQSKQSVHVWRQLQKGPFELVWSLRTVGIGPVEVILDHDNGSVSVKSIAQTDLKDAIVGFVLLRSTSG